MRRAPGSLAAQLRWVREHWAALLASDPALARRLDLALDVLAEEARALELRPRASTSAARSWSRRPTTAASTRTPIASPRTPTGCPASCSWRSRPTSGSSSSRRAYGRPIPTLADVPDEELDRLAGLGVTGLWLIGLWQRSSASADIKRRRGDSDAVASAYAIDEYRIADDLGGEAAFEELRGRAWARGIRLAADMVPNHMGIDSRWVVEHPERFISVPEPPFPAYTFSGPDLSPDPRVEITLEDHYWDGTDAAVVFRRRDRAVRRAALHLPRQRRHLVPVERHRAAGLPPRRPPRGGDPDDPRRRAPLRRSSASTPRWSSPGATSAASGTRTPAPVAAIPSRAEHALSTPEFNRLMPEGVLARGRRPGRRRGAGTLLLAEAFWLMEGYFVRTLGMHRVYNSAFMHMLRDEDNAGYRKVMRDTLEFDPGVLGRFVNFLTNPDERPAAEQLGTGDKAFSASTLLATLPGLPMLGHGQVEGFRERYGMEFRRARWDEPVDEAHAAHFEWAIVPLLRRRGAFSGTDRFRLYDAIDDGGHVNEDVYAFSNGAGVDRSLVLVHHRYAETTVRIDHSVAAAAPGSRGARKLTSERLADALELDGADDRVVRFSDTRSGWELERSAGELRREGLRVSLGPYEARVLWIDPPPGAIPLPRRRSRPRRPEPTRRRDAAQAARDPTRASTPARKPPDKEVDDEKRASEADGMTRARPRVRFQAAGPDWVQPVTLEGSIVRLEPLRSSISTASPRWRSIPRSGAGPSPARPTSTGCARGWTRRSPDAAAGTELPFATIDVETGRPIGSTRFMSIVPEHRRLEIGWTWVAPAWQRRGANQEAKYLQLRHAFEDLGGEPGRVQDRLAQREGQPGAPRDRRDVRGHVPEPHDHARRPAPALELLQRDVGRVAGGQGSPDRQAGRSA